MRGIGASLQQRRRHPGSQRHPKLCINHKEIFPQGKTQILSLLRCEEVLFLGDVFFRTKVLRDVDRANITLSRALIKTDVPTLALCTHEAMSRASAKTGQWAFQIAEGLEGPSCHPAQRLLAET